MGVINIFGLKISVWLISPLVYCFWVIVLLNVKRVAFKFIKGLVAKTQIQWDDLLLEALEFPAVLVIFTSGGLVVARFMSMSGLQDVTHAFLLAFKAVTIVAVILFVDKFANSLLKQYTGQVEILRLGGGIARGVVRAAVIGMGGMILLDSVGISITPLIASLGVGSLAIALALQPTLENLFAGMQIIVDQPFIVGHFVKLESGEEGFVHKIGWRTTWVRMPPNNMVVMPNKNLVNSKIINYNYPNKEVAVTVSVGVHYDSDLDLVERVTTEVALETLKAVSGGVEGFQPVVRFNAMDSSSINFNVVMRAKEVGDSSALIHDFIKRLVKRYAKEGIVMPYPTQAINLDQEKAFRHFKGEK